MNFFKHVTAALAAVGFVATMGAAQPATAGDYSGNFMIRLQGTQVITNDNLKGLSATGVNILPTRNVEVSDITLPTATLSYFFNKNFALELFCCFSKHSVDLTVGGVNQGEIAKSWIFPPILTLQYHFTGLGIFKPYVGVGAQYIRFFNEKTGGNILGATSVNFNDAFGPAVQAGIDVELGRGWYLNADVKKAWLETNGDWRNTAIGHVNAKAALDPMTVSLGIGYRFNLFGGGSTDSLK